jgi:hypothetical protein
MTVRSNEKFRVSKDVEAYSPSFNKLKALYSFSSHVRCKACCPQAVKFIEKDVMGKYFVLLLILKF